MAGSRRLNPAELKARLQANLAVQGLQGHNSSAPSVPTSVQANPVPVSPGSTTPVGHSTDLLTPFRNEANSPATDAPREQTASINDAPIAAEASIQTDSNFAQTSESVERVEQVEQVEQVELVEQVEQVGQVGQVGQVEQRTESALPAPAQEASSASPASPASPASSVKRTTLIIPAVPTSKPSVGQSSQSGISSQSSQFSQSSQSATPIPSALDSPNSASAVKQPADDPEGPASSISFGATANDNRDIGTRGDAPRTAARQSGDVSPPRNPSADPIPHPANFGQTGNTGLMARKKAAPTATSMATAPKRPARAVLHRRDRGAVLRGYRIPIDLHRQAERAKLALASRRGSALFWDELLQGAIDYLLDDNTQKISQELSAVRRSPELGSPSTRVLQAAIRHDQDLRLRMLRIDLEELDGATVRLEEIWTWLIRQVVKNEQ